jgi:hypothetical protein
MSWVEMHWHCKIVLHNLNKKLSFCHIILRRWGVVEWRDGKYDWYWLTMYNYFTLSAHILFSLNLSQDMSKLHVARVIDITSMTFYKQIMQWD